MLRVGKRAFYLVLVAGLVGGLSGAPQPLAAQCSLCKAQVEAAAQERDDYDVAGLNKGILYLATIPYLLLGVVGYRWYRRTQQGPSRASHKTTQGRSPRAALG